MDKKLRQVTDNIHGTIYLSKLESELISTPYFYRLHDIYQSSTVYMTFPSNRTKRYEHSLGTMELASSMLFSAVSNANPKTRNELFKQLRFYFGAIFDLAICQSGAQLAPYFTKYKNEIGYVFGSKDLNKDIDEIICEIINCDFKKAFLHGCFKDSALDHFQYFQLNVAVENENINTDDSSDNENAEDNIENIFLYRCLLQAVRIVALFHDVGHPPYSHIIEDVLSELYDTALKDEGNWNKTRKKAFFNALKPYATKLSSEAYKCQTLYADSSLIDSKLHERIGLSLLQSAINDVIPELINNVSNSNEKTYSKISKILYYIFVVELSISILVEKNKFFKSLHKIVDGVLDADRLDYIMRDSLNSGVDWGKIPYKRLINSNKLIYITNDIDGNELECENCFFAIAYPKKVTDDIVDLLLTRYKIFARINFHHRCIKTAVALQSAVLELADDYLSSKNGEEISTDINLLWTSLNMTAGDRKMRVIQWNDSWLISALHKALVKIVSENKQNITLRENLEEILLNKKRYYSLIKRGVDSQRFVKKVFVYAEITDDKLDILKNREYKKYFDFQDNGDSSNDLLHNSKSNAEDSLRRIRELKQVIETGDLELLNSLMPLENMCINDTIRHALSELLSQHVIDDYKVFTNKGRQKTGLPSHETLFDEIYLYDGENWDVFNDDLMLEPQIHAIERNVPWTYIYFVPPKDCTNIVDLSEKIFNFVAQAVGKSLRHRYIELFGT